LGAPGSFYRLVDAAYERVSVAVGSNLHPAGWDEPTPKTLATSTGARVLHHTHVVVDQGESFGLVEATSGKGVAPLA
jgi:DNA replication protein DnaC